MEATRPSAWARVRRAWVVAGIAITFGLVAWSLWAFRASDEARAALQSDGGVIVTHAQGVWSFRPVHPAAGGTALVFFPGGLVDPVAYAPLLRAAAARGFPAYLVELPRRGALGGADDAEVFGRLARVLGSSGFPERWIVAGHSRGAVVACNVVAGAKAGLVGAVLIGTTHPRDVDLAGSQIAITKIGGTRDGIARRSSAEENASRLPSSTRWIWIEGANHSQFGWYGFQPGDWPATIAAEAQRQAMIEAVLGRLRQAR